MKKITRRISRIYIIYFFALSCSSCLSQKALLNGFDTELKKESKLLDFKTQESPDLTIRYPSDLQLEFQDYLRNVIDGDLVFEYCQNEGSLVDVKYEVGFYSNKLISIKKEVSIAFCYASDVVYYDYINLYIDKQTLYLVQLNRNSDLLNEKITLELSSNDVDEDCDYDENDFDFDLFVRNNQPHIVFNKSKVCNLSVPFKLTEDNFVFKEIPR